MVPRVVSRGLALREAMLDCTKAMSAEATTDSRDQTLSRGVDVASRRSRHRSEGVADEPSRFYRVPLKMPRSSGE